MRSLTTFNFDYSNTCASIGGAEEDRTPDLLRARQALYQLSYGPVNAASTTRPKASLIRLSSLPRHSRFSAKPLLCIH